MISRAMFFKLLAAVGLGQDIQRLPYTPLPEFPPQLPSCPEGYDCTVIKDGVVRFTPQEHPHLRECKEGEERCPLGHCQKPSEFVLLLRSVGANDGEGVKMDGFDFFRHGASVCSTCGMLYVKQ